MKILLDETIPVQLAKLFPESFEVSSVSGLGWNALKNGELLERATQQRFEALVTVDRNMPFQQNSEQLGFPVLVVHVPKNRLDYLLP